jgi:hypothetical protein
MESLLHPEVYYYNENGEPIQLELNYRINIDDTLQTIKAKILQSMPVALNLIQEDIYLFVNAFEKYDIKTLYKEITEDSSFELNDAVIKQLMTNFNYDDKYIDAIPERTNFTIEEFGEFLDFDTNNQELLTAKPLGKNISSRFTNIETPLLFPANPYLCVDYLIDVPDTFDNTIYLNYKFIHNNCIYVCIPQYLIQFYRQKFPQQSSAKFFQYYFPLLFQRGIGTPAEYNKYKTVTVTPTPDPITTRIWESIEAYYQHYSTINSPDDYPGCKINSPLSQCKTSDNFETNIIDFSIKFKSVYNIKIPLDIIFKKINVSKDVPLIKLNPGMRQKNVIRLYYEQIAENGMQIPLMDKAEINSILLKIAKTKKIALFIKLENDNNFCMEIEANGDITLQSVQINNAINLDQFKEILLERINPIIITINDNIKTNGFAFSMFYNFKNDPNFKVNYINYFFKYNIALKRDFKFAKYDALFAPIFYIKDPKNQTIYNSNGAKMFYKRIQNYKGKTDKTIYIEQLWKENHRNYKEIHNITPLVIEHFNYNIEDEDDIKVVESLIKQTIDNYENEEDIGENDDNDASQQSFTNKGFLTTFMANEDKMLQIKVEGVTDMDYIICIDIYLKCIIDIIENRRNIYPFSDYTTSDITSEKSDNKIIDKLPVLSLSDIVGKTAKGVVMGDLDDYIVQHIDTMATNKSLSRTSSVSHKNELLDIGVAIDVKSDDAESVDYGDFDIYGGARKANPKPVNVSSKMASDYTDDEMRIIGKSLRNPNYFHNKLEERDPKLFIKDVGNYKGYSKCCSSASHKQPIILTTVEKEKLERDYPDFVREGNIISYNSTVDLHNKDAKIPIDPAKEFWYICPRYWCILKNRPMTESEIRNNTGDCGGIIDTDDKVIKPGKYIYEFSKRIQSGKYEEHYPYLKDPKKHPNQLRMPCCGTTKHKPDDAIYGVNEGDENTTKISKKIVNIYKADTKLTKGNFGVLPPLLEKLFSEDYKHKLDVKQHNRIKAGNNVFLRYGLEQTKQQQFLTVFADIYSAVNNYKREDTKSLVQIREILKRELTPDIFIRLFNGSLIKTFHNKNKIISIHSYRTSKIYKKTDLKNAKQKSLLIKIIRAYENYMDYIMDNDADIDHTYLWDLFTIKSPLLQNIQFNLIIVDISSRDITQDVDFLCPKNSSSPFFNEGNPTIFVIKKDTLYELIYNVAQSPTSYKITRWFSANDIITVNPILKTINKHQKCDAVYPKSYKFIAPPKLDDLIKMIQNAPNTPYKIVNYVLQYNGKVIALMIERSDSQHQHKAIYLPCLPSAIPIDDTMVPTIFIDEVKWCDFKTLIEEYENLERIIPIIPIKLQFRVMDDGLIVGLLTNTDQFIQLNAPIQVEDTMTTHPLAILQSSNYILADMQLITKTGEEYTEHEKMVKFIYLETKFYSLFRNVVKEKLATSQYRKAILKINRVIKSELPYFDKMEDIKTILSKLKLDIKFGKIDEDILLDIDINEPITNLDDDENDNDIIFPKINLVSGLNNKDLYYNRITDELIRFPQIRKFILNEDTILFDTIDDDYQIGKNEFILLEDDKNEYFTNLTNNKPFGNKYINNQLTPEYVTINKFDKSLGY